MTREFPRFDAARAALTEAALDHAAFDGWTRRTLALAAADAGLPEGADELYFPRGPVQAIDFWNLMCDREMESALADMDLGALKVRQRIAAAVMARLEPARGHREAARRAAARLVLPDAGATQARIVWRAADAMWRAVGDSSTDGNWYSKRAVLSAVFASTVPIFLEDRDPDLAATRSFLDRRIDNVMSFEKTKAKFRKARETWPDPVRTLSRLRYGSLRGPAR